MSVTESECAISSVHSSPLTFMSVTESECAIISVHSSPVTFMTVTESEAASQQCAQFPFNIHDCDRE